MKIEDVIKWCDEQSQDSKEVAICWEGGGDSGWVHMEVDGEQTNAEEADWLVDKMCDILDYGSWAGEFNANGRAVYDPVTKMFEGEDVYCEDTTEELELKDADIIEVRIPKKYFFESLSIELENVIDGGGVNIVPKVRNGILNQELIALCESQEEIVRAKATEILENKTSCEYSGWQTEEWSTIDDFNEASAEDPENYVFKIAKLEYQGSNEDINGILLDLNEYAEMLNDSEL